MRQLLKSKKLTIFISIILLASILLIGLLIIYLRIREDGQEKGELPNGEEITNEELSIEEEQARCIVYTEDLLVGTWKDLGTDLGAYQEVQLGEDKNFKYYSEKVDTGENYALEGKWVYSKEKNSLTLYFDEINEAWETILSDDLHEYFKDVVSYNLEEKRIELKMHYMGRVDFVECEESRYFIDFMNIYFYKEV